MKSKGISKLLMAAASSIALTLGSHSASAATVVYSVPMASPFSGVTAIWEASRSYWVSAFTLAQPAQLLGAIAYVGGGSDTSAGSGTGLDNWSGAILYRFYADNGNLPDPDAVIAQGTGNVQSLLPTDRVWGSGLSNPLYRLQFEFESLLDVVAGQKTWLGLWMISSLPAPLPKVSDPGYDASRLALADGAGTAGLTFEIPGDPSILGSGIPASFAFALYAADTKPVDDPAVVPLPAGLPLLVGGLGLIAAVTLRRRGGDARVGPKD